MSPLSISSVHYRPADRRCLQHFQLQSRTHNLTTQSFTSSIRLSSAFRPSAFPDTQQSSRSQTQRLMLLPSPRRLHLIRLVPYLQTHYIINDTEKHHFSNKNIVTQTINPATTRRCSRLPAPHIRISTPSLQAPLRRSPTHQFFQPVTRPKRALATLFCASTLRADVKRVVREG